METKRQPTERRIGYRGASGIGLVSYPPMELWDDWVELDSKAWPKRVERHFMLVPTTCFNCESACGLLAYVDRETMQVTKFEGNPEHPGSRGRNCAKGPATMNQVTDPDRILYPQKRVGERGGGKWERISWDEALDSIAARIGKAFDEDRHDEIMYHVGRPGEDGFTERVLMAWGIDGHNSHTNICSSSARVGYMFWMGMDRPSPDHEAANVIFLISSHLEAGHYFNPHAQRIIDARARGAKVIVFDVRLSNTSTHADYWLAPYPGSEAAILLAIANYLIQNKLYDREFVRRWFNWEEYLRYEHPDAGGRFEDFERLLGSLYEKYSFEYAASEADVAADTIEEIAKTVASAGNRLAAHSWRSAASGNLGGWAVARCLFFLNALTGSIAVPGGTYPNAWNKFVARPIYSPPQVDRWNETQWPREYPLAMHEMSILLPHFLKEGRARLDTYFTRVYNPVWTNPDGFTWIEALRDEDKIGLHVALTPTWNESAFFADIVLPMGLAGERHDLASYETHDSQWLGFRQPVLRTARERLGETISDTREVNPGEVWEENEFWIELSWRIDPDGSRGIRKFFESKKEPGQKLSLDEYYGFMFENSVPGLPEKAALEGLSALEYMRRYGAFEVCSKVGTVYEIEIPPEELVDHRVTELGRVYTRADKPVSANLVGTGSPDPDAEGRRPVGVEIDGKILRGFPTPSGKLEFYSRTLVDWGWGDRAIPIYLESHIHPNKLREGQIPLIPTFRIPVQIHTRSANSKWLDEIAHSNPLWMHTSLAKGLSLRTGDLVRVETEIGHFVLKAWVTEGIRPGIVACSHHMGRWRPEAQSLGARLPKVELISQDGVWDLRRKGNVGSYESSDPDTSRIWWSDTGVHQNLTHAVHPDPISGMHCWHQAVRVTKARPGDRYGEVRVDTNKAHDVYRRWLEMCKPADTHSPNGTRRPRWLLRPLKPTERAYRLVAVAEEPG